ncbi:hypothetical protein Pd630_LPD09043 (plasmid) [Rhodococcus opacus PD630]|nr:hypothetical protein Pd630_LPD09043 [Rhodococcus opacus PD630]
MSLELHLRRVGDDDGRRLRLVVRCGFAQGAKTVVIDAPPEQILELHDLEGAGTLRITGTSRVRISTSGRRRRWRCGTESGVRGTAACVYVSRWLGASCSTT